MKRVVFAIVGFCLSIGACGQNYFAYQRPMEKRLYSSRLRDTVRYEIILPKVASLSRAVKYPVIVVFDRQNRYLYSNTIHTIDYLTISSAIPNAIIVGISLEGRQRNLWTLPSHRKGMAEAFTDFIVDDLAVPGPTLPIDDFIFFVGHSRTAIFSSYAMSKRYDKINGVFAASTSYFDFGDELQKAQFQGFLGELPTLERTFKYYFSVGDSLSGDGHERDVMKLNSFLQTTSLPDNFQYMLYHEKNSNHYTSYGLAVGNALNDAFSDYRQVLRSCFNVLDSCEKIVKVPWNDFERVFRKYEAKTGAKYFCDLTFYNSIASYISNRQNITAKEKNNLILEVLDKAVTNYPGYEGFYSWTAEIQIKQGNYEAGRKSLQRALDVIDQNPFLTQLERDTKKIRLVHQLEKISD